MPNDVVIELPFDWVGSVLVPVAAVLVSGALAVLLASLERRAAARGRAREQAAELIRALSDMGRSAEWGTTDEYERAADRYEEELNALAALLPARDVSVPKFVCEIVERLDLTEKNGRVFRRGVLWVATSLELWCRGELKARDFEANMPSPAISWVSTIDLGQWDSVMRGKPVVGVADLPE